MIPVLLWLAHAPPVALAAPPAALVEAHEASLDRWESVRASLVADPEVSDEALVRLRDHEAWGVSLTAAAVHCWREDAAVAAGIWAQPAIRARTGLPVFVAPVPEGFAAVVAERLVHGGGSPSERAALVDWLRRSGAPEEARTRWVVGALEAEEDPTVRMALVESLRGAEGPALEASLRQALRDGDVGVRHAAVRTAGRVGLSPLVPDLVQATRDADDAVAGYAARSLGWFGDRGAFEAVAAVLERADPRARLHALRALQRLDPRRAAQLPRVRALQADPDPRVAAAARHIVGS